MRKSAPFGAFCLLAAMWSVAFPSETHAQQPTVLLDQGWSADDRLRYYWTSQGSAVLPYDLFLNLEEANSKELFRSDKIAEGFGLIPGQPNQKYNPDALPIGLTRTEIKDGPWKGVWLGMTCAACHNSQIHYKGKKIRIDGGNNHRFDFHGFTTGLADALAASVKNPDKFARLAAKLNQLDDAGKTALKTRLKATADDIHAYRHRIDLPPFPVGPGRLDALSSIHNRVTILGMGIPENWTALIAPVKPPFLWNAPQSAWVQWAAVSNDPLSRNFSEALGVWAKVDLTSKTPALGLFESTTDIRGQIAIEELLRRLAPPKWPEDVLGKIDRTKAAVGAKLFVKHCSECHSVWPHRWSGPKKKGKRFIENAIVPLSFVGTDATQFNNPVFNSKPTTIPGRLKPYLPKPLQEDAVVPFEEVLKIVMYMTVETGLAKLKLTEVELEDAHGFRSYYPMPVETPPPLPAYKAGTRDGIWATPPYLHNGSVPNLYELLIPAKQRCKIFFLGQEFDPVKVGVDTSGASGKFIFDTSKPGNSNLGHSFEDGPKGNGVIGPLLTDQERWALIEYLKSIPTEASQITPFGGPANPVSAWDDPTFFNVKNKTGYYGK